MSAPTQGNPGNFSGHYAELELAFYGRLYAVEWKLLSIIFGADLITGQVNTRAGAKIAEAEGIALASFWHGDTRLLWLIAHEKNAMQLARLAKKNHQLNVGQLESLTTGYYYCPARLVGAATELMTMLAAEKEARLCAARYVALLSGKVAPQIAVPQLQLQQLKAA